MDSIIKFIGNDYSLLLETIWGIVENSTVSAEEKAELEQCIKNLWLDNYNKNK